MYTAVSGEMKPFKISKFLFITPDTTAIHKND